MISLIKKIVYEVGEIFNLDKKKIQIECSLPKFGDVATNLVLISKNKEETLYLLEKKLMETGFIENVEFVKPGFVNINIKTEFIKNISLTFEKKNIKYSVEFCSPNPTGPTHMGHCRSGVLGNSLSNLFEFYGYDVRKEMIFNDGGEQILKFIKSIYYYINKNEQSELFYKGEYIKEYATFAKENFLENDLVSFHNFFLKRHEIFNYVLKKMLEDLKILGIDNLHITKESDLDFLSQKATEILLEKNFCYRGKLEDCKETTENDQIIFKSSFFGDSKDRVVKRGNDSFTYFGIDVGYHYKKHIDGYNNQITVLGDDHAGHFFKLQKVVKCLSEEINLEIVTHNMVNLIKNKTPISMSKREGNILTIRDFVEQFGKDATIYYMLSQSSKTIIDIDFEKINIEDNGAFYIQYAIARINSILSKNNDFDISNLDFSFLKKNKNITQKIFWWKEIVERAVDNKDPHYILNYAFFLAKELHKYWNEENVSNLSIIEKNTKLYMLFLIKNILFYCTTIIGISTPNRM